jgi:hypothetical protein
MYFYFFNVDYQSFSYTFSFINYKPEYYITYYPFKTIILPMNKSINALEFVCLRSSQVHMNNSFLTMCN